MARLAKGDQTIQFLLGRNRLESFEAEDLAALTEALIGRAVLRADTTASAALAGGDVEGAFVAAYDHTGWPRKRSWPGRPCALLRRRVAHGWGGCRVGAIRSEDSGFCKADV